MRPRSGFGGSPSPARPASAADRGPPDGELLFICHSGVRSFKAAELALAQGRPARSVRGGTDAWAKAGLPLER